MFRVIIHLNADEVIPNSSWRLGPALKDRYPEVEDFSRVMFGNLSLVKYGENRFLEQDFYLADPSIFSIFTFPFVRGKPESALGDLKSIVITEEAAGRFFGDQDPIGKRLYVELYESDFTVTGVIKNLPLNSHLKFDLIARVELMGKQRLESWEFTGFTYVLLRPGVSALEFNQKISNFYREVVDNEAAATLALQPLTRVHLYELGEPGIIKLVYIFSVIAVFILIIACINFMNLSTARSAKRAREVGIRKVTGATRIQLINQFLGESVLFSILSFLLSVFLVEITLPLIRNLTGRELSLFFPGSGHYLLGLIGVVLLTGLLAGSYPALFLSAFRPVHVLKGQFISGSKGKIFRKSLIVFQFSVSISLIICTAVVYKQLHFIHHKDLGFNREFVVGVQNNRRLQRQFDAFKSEVLTSPDVLNVTAAASNPAQVEQWIKIDWEENPEDEPLPIGYTMVDYDFFETFDMEITQGRSFSRDFLRDETEACIINESAEKAMNIESPVGKQVDFGHPAFEEPFRQVQIVGVVKDFHFKTLHKPIGPFIFRIYKPWHFIVFIKLRPDNIQAALRGIENIYQKFSPEFPFQYMFLDDVFQRLYDSERQMSRLFTVFGLLAVLISCLGLFGMASFTAEQKTKEIGIRKILGASVSGVVFLLCEEFLRWVLLANLISWPIAYLVMQSWLTGFAYRTNIGISTFILAAVTALLIALGTISYQTVKSSFANPVDSLRYE
ncbi:ABC transporter permease [Acidobacteriota bacterium]